MVKGNTIMKEVWRSIDGYNGIYEVSNFGNVRSLSRIDIRKNKIIGQIMKTFKSRGYIRITLRKEGKGTKGSVHRLVLTAFSGECPKGYQCNHIDGNKLNNRIDNLEWVTPSENQRHKYDILGYSRPIGSKNPQSKLTEAKVKEIKLLLVKKIPVKLIAEMYKVTLKTIYNIKSESAWTHIK